MIHEVFKGIGLTGLYIKVNHRGVLSGTTEIRWSTNGWLCLGQYIHDKLDKIGEDGVKNEMTEKGISPDSAQQVFDILNFKGSNEQKLAMLKEKVS